MDNEEKMNVFRGGTLFLSFIIPVYNVEAYLAECLDSLLEQDIPCEEYEIICVNDGSTDGSLQILRRYEQNFPNVRVIDQENGGVCVARNTGLDAARGEYIWFVDADDQVRRSILCQLKEKLETAMCDRLVIGCLQFEGSGGAKLEEQELPINTSWKDSVVWRSIFKKAFLNEQKLCFYPGLVFGEDALFMFECFYHEPHTTEMEWPVYYHRTVPGSASNNTSAAFEEKRRWSTLREAQVVQKYYERENGKYRMETANRLMIFLWGVLGSIAHLPKEQAKPYLEELKKSGLWPYHRPKACTVTKSYQMTRTDTIGKLFDKIYTSSHTRAGYALLRCWYRLSDWKNRNNT